MSSPLLRRRLVLGASTLALLGLAAPAFAQATPEQSALSLADEGYEVEEIVITPGAAQPGAVAGDIPPEIQLSPRDIQAYGVSNVSELLDALSPQTSSGRGDGGRPVMLVNGQRISSFVEIRDLPTEAIMRVDILPEEVSLKYGYRAEQRVINLVLRPRFRALTAETSYKTPTQGEGQVADLRVNRLRIQRDTRLMLDGKASTTARVLESDRDIANTTGDARYRTLQPESESATLTAVYSRPIREGVSATFNGSLDASRNDSLLGLPRGANLDETDIFALAQPKALARSSDAVAGHLGATVNGALKGWQWSLTSNADYTDSLTTTDRQVAGVAYTDKARSISTSADADLTANGVIARLPAGAISTTLKVGASTSNFDTRSLRAGVVQEGDLTRNIGSFQANVDLPIASRSRGVLEAVGDFSGNFNVAVDSLSDFGALTTLGYGFNWSPIKPVRVIASVTHKEGAPSVQQVGAPVQVTPGARVFDFVTGETVEVTRIEGGAPGLKSDDRTVTKLGLTLKPFNDNDLTVSADWVRTEIRDVIASFPTASSQIEAVFPDRFLRDASGRLIQIDSRPINFDSRDTEQLRWGFTWRKALGPARPAGGFAGAGAGAGMGAGRAARQAEGGQQAANAPQSGQQQAQQQGQQAQQQDGQTNTAALEPPPGGMPPPPPGGDAGAGPRGPGGPGGFGGPPGGARFGPSRGGNLQLGLYHTVQLEDRIVIRPGAPALDLLKGDAIGNSGGTSRHQVDLQANVFKSGFGLVVNTRWRSGTEVVGSAAGDLKFSDQTTVNLRLFADLGMQPWVRQNYPWLRGSRVSVGIDNLFDTRQQVRTAAGDTPINFQPDYLDPLGRQVRVSFRKLFF